MKSPSRVRYTRSRRFYFDADAARAAIGWIERYCKHTEGEWYGKPFILAPWQRRVVRKLFGWRRKDGTRRFRRCWIEVARKNGKTEFAAALALLAIVGCREPAGQGYSLATDKDQASIVFRKAGVMVALSDELRRQVESFKTALYCAANMSSFKPLSKKPDSKQGFSPSFVVGDEVHVWSDGGDLYDSVHEGEGARAHPIDVLITTAGNRGDNYAWEAHEHAVAVQRGEVEDDDLLVCIFAAGEEDDWTDEAVWRKANPNLGVSPKLSFLQSEFKVARQNPRKENRFRRYYLNQWVEQATRWIPMDYWSVCTAAPNPRDVRRFLADEDHDAKLKDVVRAAGEYDPLLWKALRERMKGRSCGAGLDLATTTDLCAWALWFPAEGDETRDTILWRFYLPRETLAKLSHDSPVRKRYESFERAGALKVTPGNVTDYDFIRADIIEDAGFFHVGTMAVDRWNATQLATDLLNKDGLPVELFGQGFGSMSGPSKEFERLFMGLELEHGNHPIANWMARNIATDEDAHENIKPTKAKSGGKIDGLVAAIMAKGMLMTKPVTQSVYERRGLLRA
jgi:phage terminase large subunit-like protein